MTTDSCSVRSWIASLSRGKKMCCLIAWSLVFVGCLLFAVVGYAVGYKNAVTNPWYPKWIPTQAFVTSWNGSNSTCYRLCNERPDGLCPAMCVTFTVTLSYNTTSGQQYSFQSYVDSAFNINPQDVEAWLTRGRARLYQEYPPGKLYEMCYWTVDPRTVNTRGCSVEAPEVSPTDGWRGVYISFSVFVVIAFGICVLFCIPICKEDCTWKEEREAQLKYMSSHVYKERFAGVTSFLSGTHPKLGKDSAMYNAFRKDFLYDPSLLPMIWEYVDGGKWLRLKWNGQTGEAIGLQGTFIEDKNALRETRRPFFVLDGMQEEVEYPPDWEPERRVIISQSNVNRPAPTNDYHLYPIAPGGAIPAAFGGPQPPNQPNQPNQHGAPAHPHGQPGQPGQAPGGPLVGFPSALPRPQSGMLQPSLSGSLPAYYPSTAAVPQPTAQPIRRGFFDPVAPSESQSSPPSRQVEMQALPQGTLQPRSGVLSPSSPFAASRGVVSPVQQYRTLSPAVSASSLSHAIEGRPHPSLAASPSTSLSSLTLARPSLPQTPSSVSSQAPLLTQSPSVSSSLNGPSMAFAPFSPKPKPAIRPIDQDDSDTDTDDEKSEGSVKRTDTTKDGKQDSDKELAESKQAKREAESKEEAKAEELTSSTKANNAAEKEQRDSAAVNKASEADNSTVASLESVPSTPLSDLPRSSSSSSTVPGAPLELSTHSSSQSEQHLSPGMLSPRDHDNVHVHVHSADTVESPVAMNKVEHTNEQDPSTDNKVEEVSERDGEKSSSEVIEPAAVEVIIGDSHDSKEHNKTTAEGSSLNANTDSTTSPKVEIAHEDDDTAGVLYNPYEAEREAEQLVSQSSVALPTAAETTVAEKKEGNGDLQARETKQVVILAVEASENKHPDDSSSSNTAEDDLVALRRRLRRSGSRIQRKKIVIDDAVDDSNSEPEEGSEQRESQPVRNSRKSERAEPAEDWVLSHESEDERSERS